VTARSHLGAIRLAVVGYALIYLVVRAPHLVSYRDRPAAGFDPVGVVALVLDGPLGSTAVVLLVLAAIIAAVPALMGWRWSVTGPVFAVLLTWVLTYRNSWGVVLHTENLMVLHVVVLALSPAAAAWAIDRQAGPAIEERARWAVRALAVATVLTYVVAGIAKLRNGGWDWVTGDVLRSQVAHDNLRKHLLGDPHSPFGGWLAGIAWLWPLLAALTQIVELAAPVALISRRSGLIWSGMAWSFHVAILGLMAILFPYQLLGVAFAPFLPLGEWLEGAQARWSRGAARVQPPTSEADTPHPSRTDPSDSRSPASSAAPLTSPP
jgi:hypothetical protein